MYSMLRMLYTVSINSRVWPSSQALSHRWWWWWLAVVVDDTTTVWPQTKPQSYHFYGFISEQYCSRSGSTPIIWYYKISKIYPTPSFWDESDLNSSDYMVFRAFHCEPKADRCYYYQALRQTLPSHHNFYCCWAHNIIDKQRTTHIRVENMLQQTGTGRCGWLLKRYN